MAGSPPTRSDADVTPRITPVSNAVSSDAPERPGRSPSLRVLFISYHYPPDGAVGAVRAGRVVAALRRAGHTVDVVTVRLPRTDTSDEPRVHRVRRLPNAREAVLWMRDRVRRLRPGKAPGPVGETVGGYVTPTDVPQWKRFLVAMALMPDDHQGFILPALARSIGLGIRGGFDLIYTSGPPHSAHLVALPLRKLTRVRWIAEFRDPWTDNANQPRYAASPRAFAMKRRLERLCLRSADHVITVTEAVAELFRSKIPEGASAVTCVRNGIEPIEALPTTRRNGGIRIVYLGSLYYRRDPRPLLRALTALEAEGALPDGVSVDFYGNCRWYHGMELTGYIRELGIESVARIHDAVPRSEAARLAREADLLILFAEEQPLQVPQKLYEYLATGKPILAFADADGETAAMLERIGGHFVAGGDDRSVRETVLEALRAAGRPAEVRDPTALGEWSTDNQMKRLVRLVEATNRRSGFREGVG